MVLHVILFDDDEPAPGMSDGGRGAASDVEAPKQPPPQAISSSMLGRHRRVPLPGPWSIMRLPRYAVPKDRNRSRSRDREEKAQDEVLNDEHHQYFSYQILRGLLYLHSCNVVHRDLKPSNILVNKNCDLKICDFGLARGLGNDEDDPTLTDYVVTRWYRAPEVVLLASEYTKSIDVWSVGCILCELIGRKPIFTGKDHLDQIKKILVVIGTPTEADLEWLPARSPARSFIKKAPVSAKQPWASIYPKITASGIDAIEKMLTFNPVKRATVADCLVLPYYETLHMPEDEPVSDSPVDWAFDKFTPTKRLLQNYIYAECWKFHPEIKERDAKLLPSRGIDQLLK
mmetsp:Transcript_101244/g.226037  ORF Transcript_101244/g.226037 Transcript_101244/m.226037 type:complete len:343 (+) Transcript_101244:127-1155(+)